VEWLIKQHLESVYGKAVGLAKGALGRFGGNFSNRAAWIEMLYVVGIVAFMAGFANAVFFPVPQQSILVYPSTGAETIPEAVLDAVVILIGAAGVYITYISGRQTTRSRMVNMYLGLALLLLILSVYMGIYLSNLK
jgi:hypothetical protein